MKYTICYVGQRKPNHESLYKLPKITKNQQYYETKFFQIFITVHLANNVHDHL